MALPGITNNDQPRFIFQLDLSQRFWSPQIMPYIRKDERFTRIQDRVKVILNIGDMLIESFEQIAETIVL
jgi:predicted secreted acid phosphatase